MASDASDPMISSSQRPTTHITSISTPDTSLHACQEHRDEEVYAYTYLRSTGMPPPVPEDGAEDGT